MFDRLEGGDGVLGVSGKEIFGGGEDVLVFGELGVVSDFVLFLVVEGLRAAWDEAGDGGGARGTVGAGGGGVLGRGEEDEEEDDGDDEEEGGAENEEEKGAALALGFGNDGDDVVADGGEAVGKGKWLVV